MTTAAEPTAAPPAPTPAAPSPATSVAEVKANARSAIAEMGANFDAQRAAQAAPEGQPRVEAGTPEGGQFDRPVDEVQPETAAPSEEGQVPGDPAVAEASDAEEPAQDGPAEGYERIEFPEGHPLREQGKTYEDVPASLARTFRSALNGAARRRDVEAAEGRRLQVEQELQATRAELEFARKHEGTFWTAADESFYQDALTQYGAEFADRYKQGKMAERDNALAEARTEATNSVTIDALTKETSAFRSEAFSGLPSIIPGVTEAEIDNALRMYAAEVDSVQREMMGVRGMSLREFAQNFTLSSDDFFRVAGDYLKSRPGAIQAAEAARKSGELKKNQVQADAKAAAKAEMIEAAARHQTNPHRRVGTADAGPRPTDPAEATEDTTTISGVKKAARSRVAAIGARIDALRR